MTTSQGARRAAESMIRTAGVLALACACAGAFAQYPTQPVTPDPVLGPDGVRADPVLGPNAVPTDRALSPEQSQGGPVLGPNAVPTDPVLGPNAVPTDRALTPEQSQGAPVLSPVPGDSLNPLPPIYQNR
jgi:hypothetical protein